MSAFVNSHPVRSRRTLKNRITQELLNRICTRDTCTKCSFLITKKQSKSERYASNKSGILCNYILSRPECCPIQPGTFMINY